MKEFIKSVEKNVLGGQNISFEEAMKLADIEEKEDIVELCNSANNVREFFVVRM
jgi:biotin synthase